MEFLVQFRMRNKGLPKPIISIERKSLGIDFLHEVEDFLENKKISIDKIKNISNELLGIETYKVNMSVEKALAMKLLCFRETSIVNVIVSQNFNEYVNKQIRIDDEVVKKEYIIDYNRIMHEWLLASSPIYWHKKSNFRIKIENFFNKH